MRTLMHMKPCWIDTVCTCGKLRNKSGSVRCSLRYNGKHLSPQDPLGISRIMDDRIPFVFCAAIVACLATILILKLPQFAASRVFTYLSKVQFRYNVAHEPNFPYGNLIFSLYRPEESGGWWPQNLSVEPTGGGLFDNL